MDTYVGSTTATTSWAAYSVVIVDAAVADLSLSGQALYERSVLRVLTASAGDLRVASFNAGSGAYVSAQQGAFLPNTIPPGTAYERHDALGPADKDRALDEAVKRLRVRQEVGVQGVEGRTAYALPAGVEQVLGGYYFASPDGTASRAQH